MHKGTPELPYAYFYIWSLQPHEKGIPKWLAGSCLNLSVDGSLTLMYDNPVFVFKNTGHLYSR